MQTLRKKKAFFNYIEKKEEEIQESNFNFYGERQARVVKGGKA